MNKHFWTDELGYIAGLLRTEGDGNVPRSSVAGYLETQYNQAARDEEMGPVANAISEAFQLVRDDDEWGLAREVIVAEIARRS